jgi:hypothetical protein
MSALADSPDRAAVTLDAVAHAATVGAAAMLLWSPQAEEDFPYAALWTAPSSPYGAEPTALAEAWSWLASRMADNAITVSRAPDSRTVAFTAPDGILVANLADYDVPVSIGGTVVNLTPYGYSVVGY